ncbi:aminopeptidase N [Arsenicicoccus sp. oral taxon 190]|uniref:aminopeptidase N n=1 Tax=Arsenicicoccus sp. oral taxon 190 TaxID=1658671 RepID=UPI00067A39EB|nr:aminopeptidase N [Arsenicicoccus sp. oral taxon 190]AKT50441.1 aminopeptidase N [Arsenicicoccus sp. oral taxon 190]
MSTRNLLRTEAQHRSQHLSVSTYRVELDLSEAADLARTTFPTVSTVTFASTTAETFLDFLGERVLSVEVNGEQVEVEHDGNRVLLRGLRQDGDNVVTVRGEAAYSRSGEGLHRYRDPVDGQVYLYTHFEPTDARRVFAGFDQPDLKGRFTVVLTGPDDWELLANQPVMTREMVGHNAAGVAIARQEHAPTPPLSTYIWCVAAGPYHRVESVWRGRGPDGEPLEVPLAALCRRSLAESFDGERILDTTRRGLDFFAQQFAFPYPWGKYDSIFVPEYNIGAMENPGLVTFNDAGYVYQSAATRSQHELRSNTILHEMAHMWFGDLVTPRWWDDLWLKESFADYMGTEANSRATEFTDAWTPFCARRKAWAYLQDQLPTTHPIVADIPDVEAARQNFDGITYAKGASVLKQLVAYVGKDAFFAGARAYFAEHAYGSTGLSDLLEALEAASGRDLGEWSRLWLQTAGIGTLTSELTVSAAGDAVERLVVRQAAVDAMTGEPVTRPHRLVVGLYALQGDSLVRTARLELDLVADELEVEEARGLPVPDLVVVNDDDLTYAKVRLDDRSLRTVRSHLSSIESSLTRAVLWSALWNACRDGELAPADYVQTVLDHAPREEDVALLAIVTANAATAVEAYTPVRGREELRTAYLEGVGHELTSAEPGSGHQLVWARTLAAGSATSATCADRVRALLEGSLVVPGLALDPELRWSFLQSLAAQDRVSPTELDAELDADRTSLAPVRHRCALASYPRAELKREAFRTVVEDTSLTNDLVTAWTTGYSQPGHAELTRELLPDYFAALEQIWSSRSQELASRAVLGLFPRGADLADGQAPEEHPVPVAAQAWLDEHPSAPGGLRRLVVEQRDHVLRALRAQTSRR